MLFSCTSAWAQADYVVHFRVVKEKFLLGEPVFLSFTIQNTGTRPFAFRYRSPDRVLRAEAEQEPRFVVQDGAGRRLPDPAPHPCGGARGTAVYGYVVLPPGQEHSERWLLNQWARFAKPGHYRVHAERRLALLPVDFATRKGAGKPLAYALALDDLSLDLLPAAADDLASAFQPYVKMVEDPRAADPAEAALVLTTLPHPFLLDVLRKMAGPAAHDRWDRKQALEGLARLGTPAAWDLVLIIAREGEGAPAEKAASGDSAKDESLRAYATLLLAEKGDTAFVPTLLEMMRTASEPLRGDVVRALGFFQDDRVNQALFEALHAPSPQERMNAILGLRNLGTKESIPALLAMLNDPDPQVRQVANFALESLTGQHFKLPPQASRAETAQAAQQWHAWWREHSETFEPPRPPACRDW